MYGIVPFIPTEGPPAATAAKAYSICTSLPEGLNQKSIAIINLIFYSHDKLGQPLLLLQHYLNNLFESNDYI